MVNPNDLTPLSPEETRKMIAYITPVYAKVRPAKRKGEKGRGRGSVPSLDRFAVLNLFIDRTLRLLSPSEVSVWICLYRHGHGGVSKVSRKRLVEQTGFCEKFVKRALRSLRRRRLVRTRRRGKTGRIAEYTLWPIVWPGEEGNLP